MYDVVPTARRLAEVVAELERAGTQVFVMSDCLPPDRRDLDRELRRAGVRREATSVRSLFRITSSSP